MLSRSMETNISSETHPFYGPGSSDYNGIGKKSLEWDLNEWKWDSDLFVATPLNAAPSDCRNKKLFPVPTIQGTSNTSSSSSGETDSGSNGKGKGDSEKRRRVVVVEDDEPYDKDGSLTLKLGGHGYPIKESDLTNWDGKNGKKGKVQGGNSNRAVCQVESCGADLSDAKDYHRRHKVCEMHAKASQALVGNATQRFCQQCSRFHLLQEFDEGKRSCRRRLAGHNKRRRKPLPLPDTVSNGSSLTDDRASGYLLISLLRILSNLHSDRSGQSNDQDLLPHLLKNLATLAGSFDGRNVSGLLQASQDMQNTVNVAGPSSDSALALRPNGISAQESSRPLCSTTKMNCISENHDYSVRPIDQSMSGTLIAVEVPSKGNNTETSVVENFQDVPCRRSTNLVTVQDELMAKQDVLCSINQVLPVDSVLERADSTLEKVRLKNFDLNSTYYDGQDSVVGLEKLAIPANMGTASLSCPSWVLQDSRQASPPQTSGNSDSASAQSLSSSNGDAQCRTDRIVFKLFGKDPSDFPLVLRSQILNWLSNSPTEIESYIRPGCIILTVYLRLAVPTWEELCSNLSSSMKRLLDVAGNDFWRIGLVYVRLQHKMAFIYNGKVVLDAPLPIESHNDCKIVSVAPIAVSISGRVDFKVKGFNLAGSTMRLLCAFEGKYLAEETTEALIDDNAAGEHDGSECLSFSCFVPNLTGRGFIEIEDHGLSSGFFPFIVAEHDVCTEIRMLEDTINVNWIDGNLQERMSGMKARTQALDFLHEIGWLLRRNHLRSRSENMKSCSGVFSLTRFKWLMAFSMDHDWCAVVKKLLDILYGGSVDAAGHSVEVLLSDMSLLHSAVRRNCRPMVDLLLRYVPAKDLEKMGSPKSQDGSGVIKFFFRPDMVGPSGVTPLHIAATTGDAESVLDALTDDPGQVGITAWKHARDNTGFTPQDYARVRGFETYMQLVQKKVNLLKSGAGHHVVLNIPDDVTKRQKDRLIISSGKSNGLQIEPTPKQLSYCHRCSQQLSYRTNRGSLLYRPVMLAMVGIAAVCVCMGLLLKGPPEVLCAFQPFRWELLDYGSI